MKKPRFLLTLTVFLFLPVFTLAYVHQTGVTTPEGLTKTVRWNRLPVDFVVDAGLLNGGDGWPLIIRALNTWDDVPYARRLGGELYTYHVDFTLNNLGSEWGVAGDGIQEVVFDETGDILEEFGFDAREVLGAGILVEDTSTLEIADALLVLNGTLDSNLYRDLEATTVHEFGHIWGLSHTFIGAINSANTEPGFHPVPASAIPTMYPYTNPVDDAYGRDLEYDDWAAISSLYPETTYAPPWAYPFGSTTGTLRGHVLHASGLPATAVHVRAVNVNDERIQVSCLSGYAGDGTGSFNLSCLPPGRYVLIIEGIDGRDGVTAAQIEWDGIGACTFDGMADQASNMSYFLNAGDLASGLQYQVDTLPLGDDDALEFGLPDGFNFSFLGQPCRRIFLYSNGFIGFHRFEDPTPAVTLPEADLHDFLSRPMAKLCPLRCDLNPSGNGDGKIRITRGAGQVTFEWQQVPIKGSTAAATFRVELLQGGTFRFGYGDVGAVDALTGYTGGVFKTGGMEAASDLLAFRNLPVPAAQHLVMYQLLNGHELANSTLTFTGAGVTPLPVRNRLLYPWLAHNDFFTAGIAVVSNSWSYCQLRISALDTDGRLLPVKPGYSNPARVDLAPYAQYVVLAGELFGFAGVSADGWIRVETDNPDPLGIQGFFLAQSFYAGVLDSLDGAIAVSDTDRKLRFTRFTGEPGTFTEVTVVNPNPQSTGYELLILWQDGGVDRYTGTIAPNGAAITQFEGEGSAWVLVESDRPVAGFAMNFNEAGSLAGQPGRFSWEARKKLVSPHYLYLDGSYASCLDLVNPGLEPAQVTVTLHRGNGSQAGNSVQRTIAGEYNIHLEIRPEVFGFNPAGLTDGWLEVSASQPLFGSMTFGDPSYALYQSTLPLLGAPNFYNLNSHLAQGKAGDVNYLTGLAALSLEPDNSLELEIYSPSGNALKKQSYPLGAGERKIGLLNEWMPAGPWPQTSGYLTAAAARGAYVYELFTTAGSDFFAAVPAQRYLPVQEERQDADNGWPETAEAVEFFPAEIKGELGDADTGYFLFSLGDGFTDEVEDLYRLVVPRRQVYLFSLYPYHQYCDLDLYIFNSQRQVVARAVNGVPGAEFISLELEPGTYYLGVSLLDTGWFKQSGYYLLLEPDAVP